jgi:hypothetical protein
LSFVCSCLFSIFVAILHCWRPFIHPKPEDALCCGDKGTHVTWINKVTETVIDSSKNFGLEVNVKETEYTMLSHHQNAGKNWDVNIEKTDHLKMYYEFKFLGMVVTIFVSG